MDNLRKSGVEREFEDVVGCSEGYVYERPMYFLFCGDNSVRLIEQPVANY